MEEWRRVENWPAYEVSDQGRVRGYWQRGGYRREGYEPRFKLEPIILSQSVGTNDYLRVNLRHPGKVCVKHIHSLVLETFVGPRPEGLEGRHLDGDKFKNFLSNLCWGTPKENRLDAIRHGTFLMGGRHPNARLFESEVSEIRRLRETGLFLKTIAGTFDVSVVTVSRICSGKRWQHI